MALEAPRSSNDMMRHLLHHAARALDETRGSPAAFHTMLRLGSAALAFEHGPADPAMLLGGDLERARSFPSARRREQFLLGRAAANRALAAFQPAGAESVGRGPEGEPLWPSGFAGSISHTGRSAVSVVMSGVGLRIGIDIETMEERSSAHLADYIIDAAQRELLVVACGAEDRAFYAGFSIKESAIKCLWPTLGKPTNYHDIALLHVRPEEGRGVACEWRFGDFHGSARAILTPSAVCSLAVVAGLA